MSTAICHLSSVHGAKDVRIFHKECVSLAAHGFDVTLIIPGTESHVDKGVNIIGVPRPSSRRERIYRTLPLLLRLSLEVDAALYHFHDPELFPVGLMLKAKGKRVVFDSHEDLPRQILSKPWIHSLVRPSVSKLAEYLEDRFAQRLDAVVAATPFIQERFSRQGVLSVVVRNSPILTEWDGISGDWTQKKRQAAYAGGITEIRGAREMVSAMEQIDGYLTLAGPVAPSLVEELGMAAESERIEVPGHLDRGAVADLYAESMVGLCLLWPTVNYLDSSPVKLFEYMAAGLPVVASDFPYWRDLVEESKAVLFVDPKAPREIARAIEHLLNHPEEAELMGKRGKEFVAERFNWQKEERTLIELYERLLS